MLDFGFYNMDCMEGMKQFPDKYFDLAIVDSPYGINIGDEIGGGRSGMLPFGGKRNAKFKSAEQRRLEASHSGGVSASRPKSTRRLMTAPSQAPIISKNWSVLVNTESSSGVIIFLKTSERQSA